MLPSKSFVPFNLLPERQSPLRANGPTTEAAAVITTPLAAATIGTRMLLVDLSHNPDLGNHELFSQIRPSITKFLTTSKIFDNDYPSMKARSSGVEH